MFGMNYDDDGYNNMDDDYDWDDTPVGPPPPLMRFDRNERYGNAYGNYRGGYPPIGMSGPRGGFPGQFGPSGPPMDSIPPLGWGGGLYYERPPMRRPPMEDKVTRYLLRCGVHRDSIKKLPKQLLQLFEPEFCGLCMQNFQSFAESRSHYVSKSHQKNQRKWISSGSGFRTKEIPLKARDLYCELCDIHITSKQHADSHYEGRAHRATVEGRREPKNKSLTLRSMQDRLNQLIRREKKFVKPLDEAQKATLTKTKETKDIPPELYCKICKTGVTCSEQMTAHLNGKRHLGKEKQHILNMMKGQAADADKNNDAESTAEGKNDDAEVAAETVEGENTNEETTAEDNEDMEDKDNEEGGENKADDFDWGNNSESWEETPVKED